MALFVRAVVDVSRMRRIILSLFITSVAIADTRSDLDTALLSLTGRDAIRARIDFELANWSSDEKSPPVNGGKASAQLDSTNGGLAIYWEREQLEAAVSAIPENKDAADATRSAMSALSVPQLMSYLNIARDFAQVNKEATVTGDEMAVWKEQPTRLLTLKLDPKLDGKNAKYIKEFEATAKIWLGADNIPVAAERSLHLKGRAMLVIGFEATETEHYEFARHGDRLVVTLHTKEGGGSGAGQSNNHRSTAVLTIESPPS